MRRFISFVHKEFCHILRDWRTMLILLVYPVVLIVLFGYAVTTEVKNVRVAVLDLSHDAVTSKICGHIAASRYLVMAAAPHSRPDVETMFRRGDIDVAVIFESGFADNIRHGGDARVQILADGSEPNQAAVRVQYVEQVLAAAKSDVVGDAVGRGFTIVPVTRMLYNPQQKSEYNFVPGVIGMILLLICAMMSSIAIVREKESGTMEVLLASPLPPACIILAKLVPYFVISCINLAAILLLAFYMLHVPMAGSLICFLGVTLLYILVSLTLGLLISACQHADCGHDTVAAAHRAHHIPVRARVSAREHAGSSARHLGHCSGAVVYRCGAQADDSGGRCRLCGCRRCRNGCHGGGFAWRIS